MCGADQQTAELFSSLTPEALVPTEHLLQLILPLVNSALERLSAEFDAIYAAAGRPSSHPTTSYGRCSCKHSSRFARSDN